MANLPEYGIDCYFVAAIEWLVLNGRHWTANWK
jgi:hypothetical protein